MQWKKEGGKEEGREKRKKEAREELGREMQVWFGVKISASEGVFGWEYFDSNWN